MADGIEHQTIQTGRSDCGSTPLTNGTERMTIEFTGLRVINVENFADSSASGADVRAVDLRHSIESRLGAANKTPTEKVLRNIGPSFSYKLRDASGQATEFNNYMLPVDVDGTRMFLLGQRESAGVPFRYLRIPADENDSLDGWFRLRAALSDAALRNRAVQRYAATAVEPGRPELVEALTLSAQRAIALFAGGSIDASIWPGWFSSGVGCRPFRSSWKPMCQKPIGRKPVKCWCAS